MGLAYAKEGKRVKVEGVYINLTPHLMNYTTVCSFGTERADICVALN